MMCQFWYNDAGRKFTYFRLQCWYSMTSRKFAFPVYFSNEQFRYIDGSCMNLPNFAEFRNFSIEMGIILGSKQGWIQDFQVGGHKDHERV